MRILHAPYNIANDPWSLSRAQRALGATADVASISTNRYVKPPDVELELAGRDRWSRRLARVRFVGRALRDYDVFHYAFATSLLDHGNGPFHLLDLRLAHRLGKCVAMTFHGCDVRPLAPGGCSLCAGGCSRVRAQRRLDTVLRCADLVYVTTPDLLAVVPEARLLPQSVWGITDGDAIPPSTAGPLRVVHAPSDRAIKGTAAVIAAVDRLRAEGVEIELTLVENMPRDRALECYRRADVGVDQLRVGWYGVFAIEMMALGKPVVAHVAPAWVALSGLAPPPVVDADEQTIERVLRDLAARRSELPALGERSRAYVLERHDALANAARVLSDYARVCGARAGSRPLRQG